MASFPSSPRRRSQYDIEMELEGLFDDINLDSTSSPTLTTSHDGQKTALFERLPALITAFEERRGQKLLSENEMDALKHFSEQMPKESVSVKDLVNIFTAMGMVDAPPGPPGSRPASLVDPLLAESILLPAAPLTPGDGSPAPRRKRTPSSNSTASKSSTRSGASSPITPVASPSRLAVNRKPRSFLSAISGSPGRASVVDNRDLSGLVTAAGGTYLGVELEGPYGPDWNPDRFVAEVRKATKGMGTKEGPLIQALADKTYPQLRSIDKTYKSTHGKDLMELIASEKMVRGYVEFTLRLLIQGPLDGDVDLVKRSIESANKNEDLLVELIVGRHPHDLELLRLAYERRQASTGSPDKTRHFNASILGSASSSKIRKAWEIVLEGRWDDVGDAFDGAVGGPGGKTHEERLSLLKEDVDQLRVALRSGGNQETATKILLARSPRHLHSIVVEFSKGGKHASLTGEIKKVYSGTLRTILLFAVENGKKDHDGPGVWRDAKMLYKSMEGMGTRNEQLAWRLVRLHWNRPRFHLIMAAFKQKYRQTLVDMVKKDTSGAWRDLAVLVVQSATQPEPVPSLEDTSRLNALKRRSRTSSTSSSRSSSSDRSSEKENTTRVLEGSGELGQPASPEEDPTVAPHQDATPPIEEEGGDTPIVPAFPRFMSQPELGELDEAPVTPTIASSASVPDNLGSSTSSTESADGLRGHKASSSLSFRQRSSPLEPLGHRPPSSAAGSGSRADRPPNALRHNRPMAPSRSRRASDDLTKSGSSDMDRSGSLSPTMARSPTPSSGHSDRAQSPIFPRSTSTMSISTSESDDKSGTDTTLDSPPSSVPHSEAPSSPSAIDVTSYHAPPISPIGDFGSPTSTPSPYPFPSPIGKETEEWMTGGESSPEKGPGSHALRRDNSTTSSGSSRPASFFGEGSGALDVQGFRPDSVASTYSLFGRGSAEQFQTLLRHANDLAKRLKDTEARLETTTSAFEQEQSDLELRLEEMRGELQTKRKDEKELRGNERQYLAQIASLESDIAKVNKSLDRSRESHDTMKKNYLAQCEESEKLRGQIADLTIQKQHADEAALSHTVQVHHFEEDRERLQLTITKLEEDLVVAGRAQEYLDDQKQENLLLKETIDRLKFEVDEMRNVGRKSLFLLDGSGGSSGPGSIDGSISRNLGRELARGMETGEGEDEASDGERTEGEAEEDSVVVTTTRRRVVKKRGLKSAAALPVTTHVEETTVVADAEVQTDSMAQSSMSAQTDEIKVEPVEEVAPLNPEADLAEALGIDLSRLKDYLSNSDALEASLKEQEKMVSDRSAVASRRGSRWTSRLSSRMGAAANAPAYFISVFPPMARPYVAQFIDSSTSFALYSIVVYLSGFLTGTYFSPYRQLVPFQMIIGSHDKALWAQYNTLGTAFGEGISTVGQGGSGGLVDNFAYYINRLIWGSVGVVRRIPV